MILTHGENSIRRIASDVIYDTDFSNFNLQTGVDTPKVGPKVTYTIRNIRKSEKFGRNCLQIWASNGQDAYLGCGLNIYGDNPDGVTCVVEASLDTNTTALGGANFPTDPIFYAPGVGLCAHPYSVSNYTLYNGAYVNTISGEICLRAPFFDSSDVTSIAKGSVYFENNTNKCVIGIFDKKVLAGTYTFHKFKQWFINNQYRSATLNIYSLKVYKGYKEEFFQ